MMQSLGNKNNDNNTQVIPPDRPHLTLLRNKTLTSPPRWSRRRCPRPTQLLHKFDTYNSNNELRAEFEPPSSPAYWKERCHRFQDLCQSSRKRIREMEEDQRQLRRRIHYLEERLTSSSSSSNAQPKKVRSVTPCQGEDDKAGDTCGVPSMIVADTNKRECFYMADCEGMSDSEYGEHYCAFDDEEDDDDAEEDEEEEKQNETKKDGVKKEEEETQVVIKKEAKDIPEVKETKVEEKQPIEDEQRDDKE
ncbi:unnamed protein product [Cylindrotheca closterium]|uniref:Uncharacterized protein n=1 Tax=Cylindrotheca closterium TaxID=2856 RepID=A0AAD2JMQ8_9STRA|nr:unnamed protein product [Cylindrotheca closterium]